MDGVLEAPMGEEQSNIGGEAAESGKAKRSAREVLQDVYQTTSRLEPK